MFVISLRYSNWYEGSDVPKAVALKNTALWDVTPCRMKQGSALSGGKSDEGIETAQYFETFVCFYQITAVTCQKARFFILMVSQCFIYLPCTSVYAGKRHVIKTLYHQSNKTICSQQMLHVSD
jgi:hypothetical protein